MLSSKTLLSAATLFFSSLSFAAPVDVNTATAAEIATALNGIGAAKAAAIVAHRQQHGPYKTAEELTQVSGIGEKLLAKIKSDLVISSAAD